MRCAFIAVQSFQSMRVPLPQQGSPFHIVFGAWRGCLLRQTLGARQAGAGGGPCHKRNATLLLAKLLSRKICCLKCFAEVPDVDIWHRRCFEIRSFDVENVSLKFRISTFFVEKCSKMKSLRKLQNVFPERPGCSESAAE
jgi:hypothetical protein